MSAMAASLSQKPTNKGTLLVRGINSSGGKGMAEFLEFSGASYVGMNGEQGYTGKNAWKF